MSEQHTLRLVPKDETPKTAADHIKRQFDRLRWPYVNLSETWRDLGCPINKIPPSWVSVALPFIEGVAAYSAKLDQLRSPTPQAAVAPCVDDHCLILGDFNENAPATWRVGDVLASYFVALAYAQFFDHNADRKGAGR